MVFTDGTALAGVAPAPAGARISFISSQDGQSVSSPVTVWLGLNGMGVAPADDNHKHFSGGQTEVLSELALGSHSLLLGDGCHSRHNPPV